MFVNITTNSITTSGSTNNESTIYECTDFSIKNMSKEHSKSQKESVLVAMGHPKVATRRLELIKENTIIFVMNDSGKTIDHYKWSE